MEQLFPGFKGNQGFRFAPVGEASASDPLYRDQVKILQISGIRHHIAVVIVIITVQTIDIDIGAAPVTEQPDLILHSLGIENLDCLVRWIGFFY